jgi:CIC family chloride channel protein
MKEFSPIPRYLAVQTSALGDRVIQLLLRAGIGEAPILIGIAMLVGTTVGFSILVFYRSIDVAARGVAKIPVLLGVPVALGAIATLAFGLWLVRLLVRYGTKDSPGENIPDVIHAVARRGGVIHLVPVVVKTVGAAITLGSGGSVGAEGPVAVLGSGLGSRIGRYFRFRPNRLKLLVSCGAAAGISGAFGAPIAGVFFALEEMVGGFRTMALAPLVVASVAAAAVTRIGLGEDLVVAIPREYTIGPCSSTPCSGLWVAWLPPCTLGASGGCTIGPSKSRGGAACCLRRS